MINLINVNQIDSKKNKVITKTITNENLFIAYDYKNKKWIAIDNTDKDFYIEEFDKLDDAIKWLRKYN